MENFDPNGEHPAHPRILIWTFAVCRYILLYPINLYADKKQGPELNM